MLKLINVGGVSQVPISTLVREEKSIYIYIYIVAIAKLVPVGAEGELI